MSRPLEKIVLRAADGVDAAENVLWVRAPRPGLAALVGIEIAVQPEPLPVESPRDPQQHVFIAVIAVHHRAGRIGARSRGGEAESGGHSRPGYAEAPLAVRTALGKHIQV